MTNYQHIIASLRQSYNRTAAEKRDAMAKNWWKIEDRQNFLELLQLENKSTLLEVGAGTGNDSLFFQQHGLQVTAIDLSPDMIAKCREKGLQAYVMDFLNLNFPAQSFDAIYAYNSLLHVPTQDLPTALEKLHALLRPEGLLFISVYGGIEQEGISDKDWHVPPRFFSRHTDEYWKTITAPLFQLISFKTVEADNDEKGWHVQSMALRRRD